MTALKWDQVSFESILADSKDGEWGLGEAAGSHTACWMIRGTDFARLNDPLKELPLRWIPDHLMKRKRLEPGDVVFEMAGGTATQTTGRSALVRGSFFEAHTEHPVLCASFCRHLRLKPEYNSTFIYYLLQALYRAGYMGVFNIQHTGVSRFQYTAFKKKTVLNIPKEPVQRKIAAVLSAYDELIENNRRRIALLEKLAEEIYREWFIRFRFPGHQKVNFVKGVPGEWKIQKIGQLFNTSSGGTPPRENAAYYDGHICWAKTGELKSTFVLDTEERITQQGLDNSPAKIFPRHTIVIAMYCAMPDISILAVDSATNQACCAFFPKHEHLHFTFSYLLIKFAQKHMINFAHGAAQQNLSQELIKGFPLLTPTQPLIIAFSKIAEPIFDEVEQLMKANACLQKTRDRLLTRLISGKLPVENLDIQFPPGMAEELNAEPTTPAHA